MASDEHYSETVWMPVRLSVTLASVTTLVIAFLSGWFVMFRFSAGERESETLVWFVITCWLVLFIVFRLTKKVRLDIRDLLQWTGQRGPTLIVRGNTPGSLRHIPLHLIEEVSQVTFEGPWWQSSVTGGSARAEEPALISKPGWWRSFLSFRDGDEKIPVSTIDLFGYIGPGLLITYRAMSPTSDGKALLWKLQFPTHHPERLKLLLESGVQQG